MHATTLFQTHSTHDLGGSFGNQYPSERSNLFIVIKEDANFFYMFDHISS